MSGGVHASLGEGGVLPARIREVIALAIAVTTECDGCIAAHPREPPARAVLGSQSAVCSLVPVRAGGPSSSSGRGVLGQYRFPLRMIAPYGVSAESGPAAR